MKDRTREHDRSSNDAGSEPFRVRLPGFVAQEAVGLGDVVNRFGHAIGMTPCGACRERRARLNRFLVFTR